MRRFTTNMPNPAYTRGFYRIIDQNYIAYRELLGTNRVKLDAGIRLKLPFFHTLRIVDMREQPITIDDINCYTQDNVPVKIGGTLFFRIIDAEKALYGISQYKSAVHEVGRSAVRSIVGQNDYDTMIRERNSVNGGLHTNASESIKNWGIECTKFEITTFGPQNIEVARKLEIQMEAERNRRENELNTRAKVNTAGGEKDSAILSAEGKKQAAIVRAEGEKQASILESEGKLASAKNNAEGGYILQQRIADAKAYEIERKAHATAELLQQIGEVVGPKEAVHFLLKQQEYEAIKSIAEGPNSKVYFMQNNLQNQPFMPILDNSNEVAKNMPMIIPNNHK
jgi:regulator of protease activity HflC (stomatin/prohibitin superfamily)